MVERKNHLRDKDSRNVGCQAVHAHFTFSKFYETVSLPPSLKAQDLCQCLQAWDKDNENCILELNQGLYFNQRRRVISFSLKPGVIRGNKYRSHHSGWVFHLSADSKLLSCICQHGNTMCCNLTLLHPLFHRWGTCHSLIFYIFHQTISSYFGNDHGNDYRLLHTSILVSNALLLLVAHQWLTNCNAEKDTRLWYFFHCLNFPVFSWSTNNCEKEAH